MCQIVIFSLYGAGTSVPQASRFLTPHSSLLTPHSSLLTSHFSLLTSHFSLLTNLSTTRNVRSTDAKSTHSRVE